MRFGFNGPSYTARTSAVADEECINFFVETRESSGAMAPSKEYGGEAAGGTKSLLYTPGVSTFATLPASPVRETFWTGSRLFAVGGGSLVEVTPQGTVTTWGSVSNDDNRASIASNGNQLLIVAGGRAYCFTLATNTLLDVTAQLAAIPLRVEFDDSYFVVHFANSNKYQMSDVLDGTTWPPLYLNEVEVFSENISSIIVNHRELWVFGQRHAQVFQDTGSAEIFDAIPGAFIETGCVGSFVPCRLDNSVFWISEDERGARMAWRSNGYTPMRISTHAVEIDLGSYPTLIGASTYAYQDGGHLFWVIYVPGSNWSWVYDVGEGLWHKRARWDDSTSTWNAHQSWCHAYAFGQHLVGDWNSGNIYTLSQNNLSDNGTQIRRLRRPPTVIDEMRWLYHSELNIDVDMGSLASVVPTDVPGFVSDIFGPAPGTSAVDTSLGGTAWVNPGNALLNTGVYASSALVATVSSNASSTATGASQGGGTAWSNPANIDAGGTSYASVSLTAGGATPNNPSQPSGSAANSASPSNQGPAPVYTTLGGFASTPATGATLYVTLSGSVDGSQGGGSVHLKYSTDNGASWSEVEYWDTTFASTTVPVTVSGITDLNTVKLQLEAACGCGPSGFADVSISVSNWYAVTTTSAQPTSQTLVAAVSGLTIPAGKTIVGLGVSFNADYTGVAPTFQIGLNVGSLDPTFSLTTSPAIYTAGGSAALWGYSDWTSATLAGLQVNFFASSTGTTTVNVNQLVVTVYYINSLISSDALDITSFGFAPALTTTPAGITAAITAYANISGVNLTVQLLKAGAPVGNAQTIALDVTPRVLTFGDANTLLGASYIASDIASAGFGLRITSSTAGGQTATVYVGYTTLQLYCPPTVQSFADIGEPPVLLDGDGNPRPPQLMIRWSDDRGKTWSNEHVVNCGASGQYTTRAIVRKLGRSRYRVYEISVSDPVPWVIVDAYLKVQ